MKKVFSLMLLFMLSLGTLSSTAEAATLASVTAKRDGQNKSVTFTGNGKYMRTTCAHNQAPTSGLYIGAYCKLYTTKLPAEPPLVDWAINDPASRSTDVFLSKGVTYRLEAAVAPYSLAGTTLTATIYDK
ncbi:hypothetical protein [Bacillus atrophaeus]|uniref:hypothetical protein n=1 Tax=Bacillus atrophaeus TaxID=1452 RepID=UPI002E250F17|nr:hypothetical protein [Bacillus atrophaeus]MED1029751.1 hypothetical protein [Bacillus atrophaeus]MED1117534.1 hypothetical protein [Bacillus atrophaeus]MED1131306.1 hypothetical protein [Bacillus atrophaeus]